MGQDPGRVRAVGASYAAAFKTKTPDQPRGHEENHRRNEEALAFTEGGCEVNTCKERWEEGGGKEVGADCWSKTPMTADRCTPRQ